jgi:predicted Zn-dependent protease
MKTDNKVTDSHQAMLELDRLLQQLTASPLGRRHFLAAVPLLMSACATGKRTRYREGDNSGQQISISVEEEKRMTQEALVEMRKDYPPLKDPDLQAYVAGLGQKVVTANQLEGRPYSYNFTVVDVAYVNAFALPAGTIFVTTPLIAMADTEAELVGVIGHEIGHVKARHAAERIDAQQKDKTSWMYAVGGGVLGGAAGFGLGKMLCPPKDNDCISKATQLGAVAGAGGGLLVQKYKFMANSREDEMEADRIGFKTAVRAGYHPAAVGAFYQKLQKMEEERKKGGKSILGSFADALSTHPPSRERVAQMNKMASSAPARPKSITSTTQFDRMRSRASTLTKAKQEQKKG